MKTFFLILLLLICIGCQNLPTGSEIEDISDEEILLLNLLYPDYTYKKEIQEAVLKFGNLGIKIYPTPIRTSRMKNIIIISDDPCKEALTFEESRNCEIINKTVKAGYCYHNYGELGEIKKTTIFLPLKNLNIKNSSMLSNQIAHELGHSIGLKHSTDILDLMFSVYGESKIFDVPRFFSIKTLNNISKVYKNFQYMEKNDSFLYIENFITHQKGPLKIGVLIK